MFTIPTARGNIRVQHLSGAQMGTLPYDADQFVYAKFQRLCDVGGTVYEATTTDEVELAFLIARDDIELEAVNQGWSREVTNEAIVKLWNMIIDWLVASARLSESDGEASRARMPGGGGGGAGDQGAGGGGGGTPAPWVDDSEALPGTASMVAEYGIPPDTTNGDFVSVVAWLTAIAKNIQVWFEYFNCYVDLQMQAGLSQNDAIEAAIRAQPKAYSQWPMKDGFLKELAEKIASQGIDATWLAALDAANRGTAATLTELVRTYVPNWSPPTPTVAPTQDQIKTAASGAPILGFAALRGGAGAALTAGRVLPVIGIALTAAAAIYFGYGAWNRAKGERVKALAKADYLQLDKDISEMRNLCAQAVGMVESQVRARVAAGEITKAEGDAIIASARGLLADADARAASAKSMAKELYNFAVKSAGGFPDWVWTAAGVVAVAGGTYAVYRLLRWWKGATATRPAPATA